jgi:hypothetical protein
MSRRLRAERPLRRQRAAKAAGRVAFDPLHTCATVRCRGGCAPDDHGGRQFAAKAAGRVAFDPLQHMRDGAMSRRLRVRRQLRRQWANAAGRVAFDPLQHALDGAMSRREPHGVRALCASACPTAARLSPRYRRGKKWDDGQTDRPS